LEVIIPHKCKFHDKNEGAIRGLISCVQTALDHTVTGISSAHVCSAEYRIKPDGTGFDFGISPWAGGFSSSELEAAEILVLWT